MPDLAQINGTKFGDTVAPINAILQVPQRLSNKAVAAVCNYFRQKEAVDDDCNTPAGKPWQLALVKLEDEAYALPLGWKISGVTLNLLSSLIGKPERCLPPDPTKKTPDVLTNSCVLRNIEQSLVAFRE